MMDAVSRFDRLGSLAEVASVRGQAPLAELLIEILERSVSAELLVMLDSEPRNRVVFWQGVPVHVDLPDIGPHLVSMLVDEGAFRPATGLAIRRIAEATQATQSTVIERKKIIARGPLLAARRRRARIQMIRLFSYGELKFRLNAGAELPLDAERVTVLEPLELLFRGLRSSSSAHRAKFLPRARCYELASSYPAGVDPFGFGGPLEQALREEQTLESIVGRGFERGEVEAALASLSLARLLAWRDAIEALPFPRGDSSTPERPVRVPRIARAGEGSDGFVIHSARASGRSGPPPPRVSPSEEDPPTATDSPPAVSSEVEEGMAHRMKAFEGKSYFQVLRVSAETESAQLERAHRHFVRRVQEELEEPLLTAALGVLQEAYALLRDPEMRARYAEMDPQARAELEGQQKAERSLRALGEGRLDEARYLADWACRLLPASAHLGTLSAAVDWLALEPSQRGPNPRTALARDAKRTKDAQLELVLVAVLAQNRELRLAQSVWANLGKPDHPLIARYFPEARP